MLRRFAGAFLVVFGLALSGTAWAITGTITGQVNGQAVKSGTVTLVQVSQGGNVKRYNVPINPATNKGTANVKLREGDRLYYSLDGGLNGKPVTQEEFKNGVPIDFSTGVGPIPQPSPPNYNTGLPGGLPPGTPYNPSNPATWTGFYIGINGSGGTFDQRIDEKLTGTDKVSDTLNNTKGMAGVGLNAGYDFGGLGIPGVTVGPTGSINYFGQSNNQVFSSGMFVGTRTNWIADLGAKAAYWSEDRSKSIYGVVGLELVNYDLQGNLSGPTFAVNRTAAGFFAGAGVEYTRPEWRMGNGQWTTFGQLTFAWFCGDTVHMAPFSPSFDYTTRIDQVRASAGFLYRFGAPPPL
jgi:hypothetical protein